MSIRTIKRQIAKARMAAMGIDRVNRKLGTKKWISRGAIRKMMRTKIGRKDLRRMTDLGVANWRRVLTGDLAEEAERAQIRKKKPATDSRGRRAARIRRAGGTA